MKKIIITLGLLVAISGVVFGWLYYQQSKLQTVQADVGNVIQVVSETGQLVSQKDFNLKFKVGGNVKMVHVGIGDSVSAKQSLAELDDQEIKIQLNEAQAALQAAQANLKKVQEGARQEDVQIYKTAVKNAETELESAQEALDNIKRSTAESIALAQSELEAAQVDLENTETIAKDDLSNIYKNVSLAINDSLIAVDQTLDSIKDFLDLDRQDKILKTADSSLLNSTTRKEEKVVILYENNQDFFVSIQNEPTNEELDGALNSITKLLDEVHELVGMTEEVLDKTITGSHMPQAELDRLIGIIDVHNDHITAKKNEITSMQQNIEVIKLANQSKLDKAGNAVALAEQKLSSERALSSSQINSAESAVRTVQGALESARNQLKFKEADPRGSDVNFHQANINQAKSRVDLINEQLRDLVLKAPADGLITERNVENGEFIGAGQTAIAMIAEKAWQIEAYIAEEDILKVSNGDPVRIILDAYGKEKIFNGKVFSSEPQRTIIEDSVYYKTIVILDEDDKNFRNGMTADVNIMTDEKNDVLRIDKLALKEQNGKFMVRIKKEWGIEDREINVGLIGTDYAEILSGLTKADEIIITRK